MTTVMTQFKRRKQRKVSIRIGVVGAAFISAILMVMFLSSERQSMNALPQSYKEDMHTTDHPNATLLNDRYQTDDGILQWVCAVTKSRKLRIVDVTNFGPTSLVILHKFQQMQKEGCPTIPVVTIDTLHLFPESYTFLESKKAIMGQNLLIVKPKTYKTQESFDLRYGKDLAIEHPQQYAYWSKVVPMYEALDGLRADAWITGRRRSQGGDRTNLPAFEYGNSKNVRRRLKINPLVDWTHDQVWEYIRDNNIPYNPLYDKGYKSLGDVRTTSKVDEDAEERAGRFKGMNKTECGIHNLPMLSSSAEEKEMQPKVQTFVELTEDTLDSVVLEEDNSHRYEKDFVFIEFYHPACSHCQRFEPDFMMLSKEMFEAPESAVLSKVVSSRFSIGRYRIPEKLDKIGMKVVGTPAVFLVQHKPSFKVFEYEGEKNQIAILLWLNQLLRDEGSSDGNANSTAPPPDDSKGGRRIEQI